MRARFKHRADDSEADGRHTREFVLAFIIGTLVGIGLAATWIPERRRRRRSGFRGASLEAAREEFGDMARRQLENTRKALRREYEKIRR